jgi:hypothetical protein
MAYLTERMREAEYNAHVQRHPLMNSAANAATQSIWPSSQGFGNTSQGLGMAAVNQVWPQAPLEPRQSMHSTTSFTVEEVDNGFILRSGKYSKICKDMDELKDQFIATIVEQQLDK